MSKKKKLKASKKNRQRKFQTKGQEQRQSTLQGRLHKVLAIPKNLFTLLLSLITIGGFLFVVYPRLSVYPGESLDSYKPFKTPFIIKNDGYLPLLNVNYSVTIDKMEDINHNKFINVSVGGISANISKLSQNKSSAIFIDRVVEAPPNFIQYAEVHINVAYKPYLIPYTFTENIRFKTNRKTTGEYIWLEDYSGE